MPVGLFEIAIFAPLGIVFWVIAIYAVAVLVRELRTNWKK